MDLINDDSFPTKVFKRHALVRLLVRFHSELFYGSRVNMGVMCTLIRSCKQWSCHWERKLVSVLVKAKTQYSFNLTTRSCCLAFPFLRRKGLAMCLGSRLRAPRSFLAVPVGK